ncbi:MAG TPA: hypothetical protein VFB80_11470 [Pirellulaceae bacterium]|nr:hypothetical protein [Pirellulaceae bacterium]
MRRSTFGPAVLALLASCALASGQEAGYPRDHHPWGRFPVGSWKFVRTSSESIDEKGQITNLSSTDTRATLLSADDAAYTLRSEITVNIAGRRIPMTPQTVKHGYYGEPAGRPLAIKQLGEAPVTIDGKTIPCEVRQVAVDVEGGKLTSTLHYTSLVAPFVLRRESSLEGVPEEKRNATLVEVIALDLPQKIKGDIKPAMYVKTTQTLPHGKKITLEVHCDDVPGGVVAHWASETDSTGRVVRRSTLELVDYGLPVVMGEPVQLTPRRAHRAAKAARRMDGR